MSMVDDISEAEMSSDDFERMVASAEKTRKARMEAFTGFANPCQDKTPKGAFPMIHRVLRDMNSRPELITDVRGTSADNCKETVFRWREATFSIGRKDGTAWLTHWQPGITPAMLTDRKTWDSYVKSKSSHKTYPQGTKVAPEGFDMEIEHLINNVNAIRTGTWEELLWLAGETDKRPEPPQNDKIADAMAATIFDSGN